MSKTVDYFAAAPVDCYDCACGWCDEAWAEYGRRPDNCPEYGEEKEDAKKAE